MSSNSVLDQITTIFRELFDDDSIVLTRETTAEDIAEWDSFNHINIIVAVEAHFGIKFQTAETEELKNVGHLVDLVERKLSVPQR